MIIQHQTGVATFPGNHVYYWFNQPFLREIITVTSAAPTFVAAWASNSTVVVNPGGYT